MSIYCENFKSIRDEITLDMQAAAITEHEDRVIKDKDNQVFLPVSVLYGPNGGGKSNILEALQTLSSKVLRPLYAAENVQDPTLLWKNLVIEPYAFSLDTQEKPTEFELFSGRQWQNTDIFLLLKERRSFMKKLDRIKLLTGRKSALFERSEKRLR